MSIRYVPPVASPVSAHAVAAALLGSLRDADPAIAELDRAVRQRFRARDVVFTDSGTSALTLALLGSEAARRAPVAMPAYVCYDLATAAAGADVPVVLYDLDPHTLQPDPDSVRAALRAGAETIVVAHLYGMPVDVAALRPAFAGSDPLVMDDAAQGAGATMSGLPAGAAGNLGMLSFGRGKGLTGGGGGALFALDARGARLLDVLRARVRPARIGARQTLALAGQWVFGRPAVYGLAAAVPFLHLGETRYREPAPIRGLARSAARAVSVTWHLVEADAGIRRRNAGRLLRRLEGAKRLETVRCAPGAEPGYLRLPVLFDPSVRDAVAAAARLGVQRGYPEPLARVEGLRGRCLNAGERFPGAAVLADRLCTLPTHRLLRAGDLDRLERWVGLVEGAA